MARYKMVNGDRIQFTAAEETARDAEEATWESGAFDRAMADLRQRRNALLTAIDFYALSDVTMSADMTTYRQNLRDLTNGLSTVADINSVVYPTKP
mgnify:FL=1|jgi:hypothetical protein|tara:strand:- start:78 stop:365 length:288 start_codon:yes stop_codon:yes gene_type:complete